MCLNLIKVYWSVWKSQHVCCNRRADPSQPQMFAVNGHIMSSCKLSQPVSTRSIHFAEIVKICLCRIRMKIVRLARFVENLPSHLWKSRNQISDDCVRDRRQRSLQRIESRIHSYTRPRWWHPHFWEARSASGRFMANNRTRKCRIERWTYGRLHWSIAVIISEIVQNGIYEFS